jgi:uncharacterized membrane protein
MRSSQVPARFPEIDQVRGVAIIMMVVFHIAFDLYFFGIVPIPANQGPWRLFALCTASLFLLLVGISLSISSVYAGRKLPRREFILKYVGRGAFILSLGFLITAVTWFLIPEGFIRFGILHLIGIAVMMSPLYIRYRWLNLIGGAIIIAVGSLVTGLSGNSWLLWAGIHPADFTSIDYTPIFPWLGVVLIGVFAGKMVYPGGMRRPGFSVAVPSLRLLEYLGRHSLIIYLVHQPVIIGLIWFISGIMGISPSIPFPA